jgi:Flp pilus assembly protein protease CpaA
MKTFLLLAAFAGLIGIIDILSLKIPDFLLAGLFLSLIIIDVLNHSYMILFVSLLSAIVLFALFFFMFRFFGGMGFGDVKYAGVIGYALGFQKALYACLLASIMGILFFFIIHFISRYKRKQIIKHKEKIPFAPFLSFALILFSIERLI